MQCQIKCTVVTTFCSSGYEVRYYSALICERRDSRETCVGMINSKFLADTSRLHNWSGDISWISSESSCVFIRLVATLGHRYGFCLPYYFTCKFVFLWAARLTATVCATCSRYWTLNVVYIADKNDTQAWKVREGTILPVPRVHVGFMVDRVALGLFFSHRSFILICNSTRPPYLGIHLSLTLYKLNNWENGQ